MIKQITENIFNEKTQSSDRLLFDIDGFRLIDGERNINSSSETEQSYFLFNDNINEIYELDLKQAYDLLALYADKDVEELVLCQDIIELIKSI
jgi:hypothetical protein